MGKLKRENWTSSHKNVFDLLGYDEDALSKAFAYLLGENRSFYFDFIKRLRDERNSKSHFEDVEITIQKDRDEGRTDIEIKKDNDYHVIIECKVKRNKVKSQRTQYLQSFDDNAEDKHLVFLTQQFENFKLTEQDLEHIYVHKLTWLDVLQPVYKKQYKDNDTIQDFKEYFDGGFQTMDLIKEILVQDIGEESEVTRFLDYQCYKREETYGKPLYFAPYFTQSALDNGADKEGASYLSEVLGVLTMPSDEPAERFEDDLKRFAKRSDNQAEMNELVDKWKQGINLSYSGSTSADDNEDSQKKTYYLLDNPIDLERSIVKRDTQESDKVDSLNNQLSNNLGISFDKFIQYLNIN